MPSPPSAGLLDTANYHPPLVVSHGLDSCMGSGQNRKQVGSSGMTVPGIVSDSSQSVLRRNHVMVSRFLVRARYIANIKLYSSYVPVDPPFSFSL